MINGAGPLSADILVVAQNPGRLEEIHGYPLYEEAWSGSKLRYKLMPLAGVDPELVRYENIVRCRPPHHKGGDDPPTAGEVKKCAPFLLDTITEASPRVIITIGSPAWKWFSKENPLSSAHGFPFKIRYSELVARWKDSGAKSKKARSVGSGKEAGSITDTEPSSLKDVSKKPTGLRGSSPTDSSQEVCGSSTAATIPHVSDPNTSTSGITQTTCETLSEQGRIKKLVKPIVPQGILTMPTTLITAQTEIVFAELADTDGASRDGRESRYLDFDLTVVPMFHPAASTPNRNPALAKVMISDWKYLGEVLAGREDEALASYLEHRLETKWVREGPV